MFKSLFTLSVLVFSYFLHPLAQAHADKAHVDVADAWIRPTVAGQKGTGGFMKLTAREDLTLTGISTKLTKVAEVHEMRPSKDKPDVLEMRAIPSLALPKGQTVELKPGGHHLMLLDLTQQLQNGESVPVTLHFKNAKGQVSKLDVAVPVGKAGQPATHTMPKH